MADNRCNDINERLKKFEWERMNIPDLQGKVAIVIGGNSGLGFACCLGLAYKNATVILACRNKVKGLEAAADINNGLKTNNVHFMELDVSSFRSIELFVDEFQRKGQPLHILINNAGVMMPRDQQGDKTPEGLEVTMATNYFGPVYLTHLLLPIMRNSAPARVINLGSCSEQFGRVPWEDLRGVHRTVSDSDAYGSTKVMAMMNAKELNERLRGTGIEAFAPHPGVTQTELFDKADNAHKPMAQAVFAAQWLYGQPAERGASPILFAAASPDVDGKGGAFIGGPVGTLSWLGLVNLDQFKERTATTPAVQDMTQCARLYDETLRIIEEITGKHLALEGARVDGDEKE